MHDQAPFRFFPRKPSGDLSEAHAFCAHPDGLPYRAQPVYESNAAMGNA
jgi:hypothetical protein